MKNKKIPSGECPGDFYVFGSKGLFHFENRCFENENRLFRVKHWKNRIRKCFSGGKGKKGRLSVFAFVEKEKETEKFEKYIRKTESRKNLEKSREFSAYFFVSLSKFEFFSQKNRFEIEFGTQIALYKSKWKGG